MILFYTSKRNVLSNSLILNNLFMIEEVFVCVAILSAKLPPAYPIDLDIVIDMSMTLPLMILLLNASFSC